MRRGMGGAAFEPVEERTHDAEVTLGPVMLAMIGLGLLALCGVCFIAGYTVGHRGTGVSQIAASAANPAPAVQAAVTQPKPLPAPAVAPPATASDETSGAALPADGATTASAPAAGSSPVSAVQPAQATVASAQPVQTTPAAVQWMVQIAAVSHPEDADILVSALRKRSYAVSSHHDAVDGLIHILVGPFNSRDEAAAMRQRLLSDGYNAVIQP